MISTTAPLARTAAAAIPRRENRSHTPVSGETICALPLRLTPLAVVMRHSSRRACVGGNLGDRRIEYGSARLVWAGRGVSGWAAEGRESLQDGGARHSSRRGLFAGASEPLDVGALCLVRGVQRHGIAHRVAAARPWRGPCPRPRRWRSVASASSARLAHFKRSKVGQYSGGIEPAPSARIAQDRTVASGRSNPAARRPRRTAATPPAPSIISA